MTDLQDLLKNPRGRAVAVVGGGKTGAAAARLLLQLGAHVTVCDDAPEATVRAGLVKAGLADASVVVRGGGLDEVTLRQSALMLLSPGVPRAHPAVAAALAQGVPCVNELELAAAQLPAATRYLGITGTNGKSTTTTLAGEMAKAADATAFVGGNLGTPLCAAVAEGLTPGLCVLELSSYQLETITTLRFAAVTVTNLAPDHLDRYPSVDAYYAAKANIFALCAPGAGVSLNAADPESTARLLPALTAPGQSLRAICHFDVPRDIKMDGVVVEDDRLIVTFRGRQSALALQNPHIVGHHNRQNAAAAAALCLLAGIPLEAIAQGLASYAGIAHRLERVGSHGGVAWFNDSKATNVDAAVTAVRSFARGVHLIAGGTGKGSPYAPLVEAAAGRVVAVYVIGQDAPAIAAAFAGRCPVVEAGTLARACALAAQAAQPGDAIVLSPACASFDQFRDYVDRGEQFRALFAAAVDGGAEEVLP